MVGKSIFYIRNRGMDKILLSHTPLSFSPGIHKEHCIRSWVSTLKKQASRSYSQSLKAMEKQAFFKKDMERCHLYAQIKLAKNIGPFKVPAVLLYVSNGKIAPDPGFYYYCYYLKCHLRKKISIRYPPY